MLELGTCRTPDAKRRNAGCIVIQSIITMRIDTDYHFVWSGINAIGDLKYEMTLEWCYIPAFSARRVNRSHLRCSESCLGNHELELSTSISKTFILGHHTISVYQLQFYSFGNIKVTLLSIFFPLDVKSLTLRARIPGMWRVAFENFFTLDAYIVTCIHFRPFSRLFFFMNG